MKEDERMDVYLFDHGPSVEVCQESLVARWDLFLSWTDIRVKVVSGKVRRIAEFLREFLQATLLRNHSMEPRS